MWFKFGRLKMASGTTINWLMLRFHSVIIFKVIYNHYEVEPRGVGSMLQMLVLTGGELRPLGNS